VARRGGARGIDHQLPAGSDLHEPRVRAPVTGNGMEVVRPVVAPVAKIVHALQSTDTCT
jgi:hypothetical protein